MAGSQEIIGGVIYPSSSFPMETLTNKLFSTWQGVMLGAPQFAPVDRARGRQSRLMSEAQHLINRFRPMDDAAILSHNLWQELNRGVQMSLRSEKGV